MPEWRAPVRPWPGRGDDRRAARTRVRVDAGSVVLDVGGVGYLLSATSSARRLAVDADGAEVTLVTHLHVREDALQLFGFAGAAERELFELLLGVLGHRPQGGASNRVGVCPRSDPAGGGGGRPRALHQHPRDRPQDRRAAGDRPQGQGRIGRIWTNRPPRLWTITPPLETRWWDWGCRWPRPRTRFVTSMPSCRLQNACGQRWQAGCEHRLHPSPARRTGGSR